MARVVLANKRSAEKLAEGIEIFKDYLAFKAWGYDRVIIFSEQDPESVYMAQSLMRILPGAEHKALLTLISPALFRSSPWVWYGRDLEAYGLEFVIIITNPGYYVTFSTLHSWLVAVEYKRIFMADHKMPVTVDQDIPGTGLEVSVFAY